ncbi:MAG: hypothetical protein A2Z72_00380 [Omnitrophica bacterium RBG_13_46_9]|nr:MAG: hypothetical protein A2Z72_00380 [Omnitrophica bacterium RBG_13_46_9]
MRKEILVLCIAIPIILVVGTRVNAQDDGNAEEKEKAKAVKQVIVTASRVEEDASKVANDVTVITEEEIKEQEISLVVDALRLAPDIYVSQNGAYGGLTSVYLRGVPTGETLIMINGMRVYDPMSTDASFNAAFMSVDNVERIEILKGPQSVLYGSQAIGGAINIITKRGKGKPEVKADGSLGSFRTKKGHVESSGSLGPFDYALSASGLITDGISKVNERENQGERDFCKMYNFDTRLDYNMTEFLSSGVEFRYNYGWSKLDDGANQDDPNKYGNSETITLATYADLVPFDWWKSTASFAMLRYHRIGSNDESDTRDNAEDQYDFYHGKDFKAAWQNSFFVYDIDTLTTGLEFDHEEGNSYYWSSGYESLLSKKFNETKSAFVNNVFHYWGFYVTTGIRYDKHSRWGTQNPHRIAAAYNLDWNDLDGLPVNWGFKWSGLGIKTKIRGSYATGFKAPSIYQLYSPYGKPDLKPERSWGWDLGIEQSVLGDKLFGEITYFDNNIKDLIDYSFITSSYDNEGSAEMSGYEISFHLTPFEWLKAKGGYTYYTKLENKVTKERLARRPLDRFNLNVDWRIFEYNLYKDQPIRAGLNFNAFYAGNRYDETGWPSRWELLQSYWKFDMVATVGITRYFSFYCRVDNLTDRFYEEVYGYQTLPRNYAVGFNCKLEF